MRSGRVFQGKCSKLGEKIREFLVKLYIIESHSCCEAKNCGKGFLVLIDNGKKKARE